MKELSVPVNKLEELKKFYRCNRRRRAQHCGAQAEILSLFVSHSPFFHADQVVRSSLQTKQFSEFLRRYTHGKLCLACPIKKRQKTQRQHECSSDAQSIAKTARSFPDNWQKKSRLSMKTIRKNWLLAPEFPNERDADRKFAICHKEAVESRGRNEVIQDRRHERYAPSSRNRLIQN